MQKNVQQKLMHTWRSIASKLSETEFFLSFSIEKNFGKCSVSEVGDIAPFGAKTQTGQTRKDSAFSKTQKYSKIFIYLLFL